MVTRGLHVRDANLSLSIFDDQPGTNASSLGFEDVGRPTGHKDVGANISSAHIFFF